MQVLAEVLKIPSPQGKGEKEKDMEELFINGKKTDMIQTNAERH